MPDFNLSTLWQRRQCFLRKGCTTSRNAFSSARAASAAETSTVESGAVDVSWPFEFQPPTSSVIARTTIAVQYQSQEMNDLRFTLVRFLRGRFLIQREGRADQSFTKCRVGGRGWTNGKPR